MRGPELRVLYIATIVIPFVAPALVAITETAREKLASWYYVTQPLAYGGCETGGSSFYTSCEYEQLSVAVSMSKQSEHNGIALHTQFASDPLCLVILAHLEVSDMEAYAVSDVESRACFYALFHVGTPITVKVTGVDPQLLQLLQLSSRNADTGARQLEAICPVLCRTDQ